MTKENFTYWLNGFLELSSPDNLNTKQVDMIKEHLVLALKEEIKGDLNKLEVFVHWLEGFLCSVEELDDNLTNILKNKISECFIQLTGKSAGYNMLRPDNLFRLDKKLC